MILTVELRCGDRRGPDEVVALIRIRGPSATDFAADYDVGAVERTNPWVGTTTGSLGCVIAHDRRDGLWDLVQRACAGIRSAETHELRCRRHGPDVPPKDIQG